MKPALAYSFSADKWNTIWGKNEYLAVSATMTTCIHYMNGLLCEKTPPVSLHYCYRIDSSFHGKEHKDIKMPNAHAQNIYSMLWEKFISIKKFHDINHKLFKNKPYVYYTIRTQYAASLGIRCQFVKIYPVTHNPLHIHRLLVDEWNF